MSTVSRHTEREGERWISTRCHRILRCFMGLLTSRHSNALGSRTHLSILECQSIRGQMGGSVLSQPDVPSLAIIPHHAARDRERTREVGVRLSLPLSLFLCADLCREKKGEGGGGLFLLGNIVKWRRSIAINTCCLSEEDRTCRFDVLLMSNCFVRCDLHRADLSL